MPRYRSNPDPFTRIFRTLRDLDGQITTLSNRLTTDTGWAEPLMQNAWLSIRATPASYWRGNGLVFFGGRIQSGAVNTVVFSLPETFRPSIDRSFLVNCATAAGVESTCRIDILADGDVMYIAGPATPTYVALDGISFLAEQ